MSAKVLFVDDDEKVLQAYYRNLHKRYALDIALGGEQGLIALQEHGPYQVIVADMQMPRMDGITFLKEAQGLAPDSIRIMLTGNADQRTAMDAVNQGHVFRFLNKPCPAEHLALALDAGIHQYQLVTAERELLEKTLGGSIQVLTEVLAMGDPQAFGRAQILQEYALQVARVLKVPETWALALAAQLCQIGIVTLPPELLAKLRAGTALGLEEQATLRRLPEIGARLLNHIPRLEEVIRIILYQNKNFDGTGHPADNLRQEAIPLGARILRPLIEFVEMEAKRKSRLVPLEQLRLHRARYDPRVLEAMETLFEPKSPRQAAEVELPTRLARLEDLSVGQWLVSNVETRDGMVVIPGGTRLAHAHLEKLANFARMVSIKEPFSVRNHG